METSLQTFCSSSSITRIDTEDTSSLGGTLGLNDKQPATTGDAALHDMYQHVKGVMLNRPVEWRNVAN